MTIPSKMCSRPVSWARRTVPTWTPSDERTGVPRLSTLKEIAWPSSSVTVSQDGTPR